MDLKEHDFVKTASALVIAGKGLLAMDESNPTCNKRFAQFGIEQTPEARRAYRELIVTTPDLAKYISGAILYDETIHQKTSHGLSFIDVLLEAGIIPGIKVDKSTTSLAGFPGEKITEGLDGLRERLKEYAGIGLTFAKWRATISIAGKMPTDACIHTNMQVLAQYAALCQEAGLAPIVEPEVLMDGNHTMAECNEVTEHVLHVLFDELYKQGVILEGMLLKPNMVLPGLGAPLQNGLDDIVNATVKCLLRHVPAAVPGVAFLSGGQSCELASARLNEMNMRFKGQMPWELTFSFSRAIQLPALELWKGLEKNRVAAQQALAYRAKCNSEARSGQLAQYLAGGQ